MAKRKTELPDDKKIIEKKKSFSSFVDDVIEGKTDIIKKNTAQHKLELIKDELLSLKDKDLSFKTITLMIKEHFDLNINEQTVRKYCQEVLGFEKKRKGTQKIVSNKNTTNTKEEENKNNPADYLKANL